MCIPASQSVSLFAPWPPSVDTRQYFSLTSSEAISSAKKGWQLPAKSVVEALGRSAECAGLLDSTQLYLDLPAPFFAAYLEIQRSEHPILFPRIMEDKNISVRACLNRHKAFNDPAGPLHLSHWAALGWPSLHSYEAWLDTSMLFAFSHCLHYCSVPRVFDADRTRNASSQGLFYFQQLNHDPLTPGKKTNILSVTGFEYRGFSGSIRDTLPEVSAHSKTTMEYLLAAAVHAKTTDVVLIPYGMGVFIPSGAAGKAIKEATFAGMIEALRAYDGPLLSLHCCGGPGFYDLLARVAK